MLSKQQISDSELCEIKQKNGEDMECCECSCSVCIAQLPTEDKKVTIKQFLSYAKREGAINTEIFAKLEKFASYYVDSI